MIKKGISVFIIMLLAVTQGAAMSEQEKIKALLLRVEKSGLVFIRNGTEYSSRDARKHLELKLSKAGPVIKTAEQFISYIATGSSWSGTPYYIKLHDGTLVKSSDWLRKHLAELEKKR